ncbi:hypothetical protein GIB67_036542, partial [Kingdonia uniflora]
PKVAVLDFKHIMVRMTSEQDVTKALSRESRQIKGFFFKLARWTIDFDPKRDSPFAPVWVQFPGLKLYLQNNGIIKEMAGLIGKYLITDARTLSLSRPSTARVCVEATTKQTAPSSSRLFYKTRVMNFERTKQPWEGQRRLKMLLSNKAKLLGTRASQQHTMATVTNNNTHGIKKLHLLDTSTNNKIMHSPKVINTADAAATNSENVDVEILVTDNELATTYDTELELTVADSASAKHKNVMENLVSDGELTAAYGSEFERGFHSDMEGGTCKDWTLVKKVCSRPQRMPLSVIKRSKSTQQPPN